MPELFFACTLNRIVLPTSAEVRVYLVEPPAPPIVAQLPPFLSQRSQ